MKYVVLPTDDWTQEEIQPYFKDLKECFEKITKKFPDDLSPEHLVECILSGLTKLWLVFDEDQKFVAFVTTQLEVSLSGVKRVNIKQLAGKAEVEYLVPDVLYVIEGYAREIGAEEITICGRLGWKRELQKYGYGISYARYGRKLDKTENKENGEI